MKNRNSEASAAKSRKRRLESNRYFDYTEVQETPTQQALRKLGPRYEKDARPPKTRIIDYAAYKNAKSLMTAVWNAGFFIKMYNSYHFSILVRAN